jgi:hypothetical protein
VFNREWLSNLRRLVDTDTSDAVLIRNAFHLGNSGGDDHDAGLEHSADSDDAVSGESIRCCLYFEDSCTW